MDIMDAMTQFLIRSGRIDADRTVVDWDEKTAWSGGCETCYFEWQEVEFTLDNGEKVQYADDLGTLIRNLTY